MVCFNWKKVFVLTVTFAVCLSAFNISYSQEAKEKFKMTVKPQDAVFYIGSGWTGGMGSMPVLDRATNRPKKFNDEPVFFDESRSNDVEKELPSCYLGRPMIIVSANIQLKPMKGENSSIEGAPQQSYYIAAVNKLYDIKVNADKCKD